MQLFDLNIEQAIQINRSISADLYRQLREGEDVGAALNASNDTFYVLQKRQHELTGQDPAPYRIGR